jgi:hypothetical protein
LAEIAILPRAEFDRALAAFRNKHKDPNPFVLDIDDSNGSFGHLQAMRNAFDRKEARVAMLQAAIKVVQDGPEQLKTIKDPFGDGPFKHCPFDGGFELESSLRFKDTPPITVTVGLKKKK